MTLWSGVADYVIFLTTFICHNHPLMIHTACNSDQNEIPDLQSHGMVLLLIVTTQMFSQQGVVFLGT